jgi:hypothetical protein
MGAVAGQPPAANMMELVISPQIFVSYSSLLFADLERRPGPRGPKMGDVLFPIHSRSLKTLP